MSLKLEGFKNLKIQKNVPDFQHQVESYNTVIIGTYLYHGNKDQRNDNDKFH